MNARTVPVRTASVSSRWVRLRSWAAPSLLNLFFCAVFSPEAGARYLLDTVRCFQTEHEGHFLEPADLNDDGAVDLVLIPATYEYTAMFSVLFSLGDGYFADPVTYERPQRIDAGTLCDLDRDGDLRQAFGRPEDHPPPIGRAPVFDSFPDHPPADSVCVAESLNAPP